MVLAAVCALVLAASGFGLWFWRYAATYAPLTPAGYWGPYATAGKHLVDRTTDLGDELYIDGPAGTQAEFITGLVDTGSHDVKITSFDRNPLIARIRWTPYITKPGGDITGERLQPRNLPAEISGHNQIRLIITFRKPPCQDGLYLNTDRIVFRWHALGVDHQYDMQLGDTATFVGCPTLSR